MMNSSEHYYRKTINMKNKYMRHFIMAMVSSICLGFGCSFLIRGQIGSDAMTTLMEGLANILKTTSTVTNIYINITAFILAVTATPFCHKSDMLNCQCLI